MAIGIGAGVLTRTDAGVGDGEMVGTVVGFAVTAVAGVNVVILVGLEVGGRTGLSMGTTVVVADWAPVDVFVGTRAEVSVQVTNSQAITMAMWMGRNAQSVLSTIHLLRGHIFDYHGGGMKWQVSNRIRWFARLPSSLHGNPM